MAPQKNPCVPIATCFGVKNYKLINKVHVLLWLIQLLKNVFQHLKFDPVSQPPAAVCMIMYLTEIHNQWCHLMLPAHLRQTDTCKPFRIKISGKSLKSTLTCAVIKRNTQKETNRICSVLSFDNHVVLCDSFHVSQSQFELQFKFNCL